MTCVSKQCLIHSLLSADFFFVTMFSKLEPDCDTIPLPAQVCVRAYLYDGTSTSQIKLTLQCC